KLARSGTRTIKFVDRTFNCDVDRAYRLFEYIIGLDTACCFHMEVGADLFDERTLALLAAAPPGRFQLEAGLQSFHEPTLLAVSRKTDQEAAERNIRTIMRGRNIHVHIDLIAGLPHETLADFRASFARAYGLGAHNLQLGFLKLLHGSKLREDADALGIRYCPRPPYEILHSPWLSEQDLQTLKHAENALRSTYNKGRFLQTLEYVCAASGLDPFSLFGAIGTAAPNHATDLTRYAEALHGIFAALPGIDGDILRDNMHRDWLMMVTGKNTPPFLRKGGRNTMVRVAERKLGRTIARDEAATLSDGTGVFVDSRSRDPVTGLYALHHVSPEQSE
ncbi:MAG: DUF4080 domain-containing protein, partial [Defluviitaleaceae bacterium]|nr:DUF4080 domain-containing protein [Defluviitaleaceae bacterium]